ncbi:MAG: outer membrane lipoprotein chaperone LolA [Pseudoxanthomonas sp.]
MKQAFLKHVFKTAMLAVALVAGAAQAGARDELKTFTTGLKGLDGQFSQQVLNKDGRLKESSSGRVALSAPSLFRWEYTKPYEQLIVADGKKVWIYEPDLKQATVRDQGTEEQNSPLAALLDPTRLDQMFQVEENAEQDGLQWMTLWPKDPATANFERARLGFNAAGLARMEVTDAVGQRTAISFTGWKRNPSFGGSTFKYAPAAGVDVVSN